MSDPTIDRINEARVQVKAVAETVLELKLGLSGEAVMETGGMPQNTSRPVWMSGRC